MSSLAFSGSRPPVVLLLCILCLLLLPESGFAQSPPLSYERYDVEIDVRPDGSFSVREVQQVRFDGEFRTGFAEIPTDFTEDIRITGLIVDGVPYTPGDESIEAEYSLEYLPTQVALSWRYPSTRPGDVREFVIEYEVLGGLWLYEEGDRLEWRAIPADRSGIPVESSAVTVTLPSNLAEAELAYAAIGPGYEATVPAPGRVEFVATEPIPDGMPFLVSVGFPHGVVDATRTVWQVREDEAALVVTQPLLQTEVTLHPDGTLSVVERQEVEVEAGALLSGYRDLSLAYLDGVENILVAEGPTRLDYRVPPCDNCYQVETLQARRDPVAFFDGQRREVVLDPDRFGVLRVAWQVPPLVRGEATTFLVSYDVTGALLPGPDQQTLRWTAGWGERPAPAGRALMILTLPPGVAASEVGVEGGRVTERQGGRIVIAHEGPLPASQSWGVSVTLPPDATTATMPAWAEAVALARDEARAADTARARVRFALGTTGLLLALAGVVGAWLLWFRYGRDDPAPIAAEYLSEPPSPLPPGVVSYLLDERVTSRGVLASIFRLAELGLLDVDLTEDEVRVSRSGPEKVEVAQVVVEPSGARVTLPQHLVSYYNALVRSLDEKMPLSAWLQSNRTVLPRLYWQMGSEAREYFAAHPDTVRRRWLSVGQILVLGGSLLGALMLCWLLGQTGVIAGAPAVGVVAAGIALIVVSRWMPRRTALGSIETEKWRAFQRYLSDLKSYGSVERAQHILDDYFAYAVALGVEQVVLRQASEQGAVEPPWTRPVLTSPPGQFPSSNEDDLPPPIVNRPASPGLPSPSAFPPLGQWPTLQGTSDSIARSLQQGSNALTRTLNRSIGRRDTPFSLVIEGATEVAELSWEATTSTAEVLGDILESAGSFSGGGGGGFKGGGSGRSSFGSSFRSGSSSFGRSSGGGGRRGFG